MMHNSLKKTLFYLAILLLCISCGQRYSLFEGGQSEYRIVVDAAAPETEQYAACELQYWLREVSGAEIPIVGLEEGVPGKRLIVGHNSLLQGEERPDSRDDAFTWRSQDGDIFFWGGSKRGTLYSVYSFLEEELGCRWYSSAVSVAPKRDRWRFGKLDHHEEPGLLIRDNCVLDVRTNPAFSARMRNNFIRVPSRTPGQTVEGSAEGYWGVHALGYHVSSARYFATHPEYFSLRDGVRQSGYAQPCLSNPDVLAITIESLRKVMRDEPDYLIYSVEQCDNQLYCECPECQALAEQYGGQSGVMLWFVNQVADAVKKEFPDKFVGTFAYQYTRHAPKDIVPRENVVVRLCSIECCMLHEYDACERNLDFEQDLHDWAAIAPHLYIWDYVTDFSQYCLPVANWKTLKPHIQDYRDSHAIGILEEGDYQTVSCELRELRSWLISKLLWNPDADVDALVRDFTDGYYGPAGRHVREYLDLEERILRRPGIHAPCYISVADSMYTEEYLREGRRIFAEAQKAVGADTVLQARLETAEFPLCFIQMERSPLQGMASGADALVRRVIARDGIDRMAEGEWGGGVISARKLLERYDGIEKVMREAPLMPAVQPQALVEGTEKRNGVSFSRYEGDFMSTVEMLEKGRLTGRGTKADISIDEPEELDHFGYVFDTWFEAREEGVHQFSITTDDGTVLLVDGVEVFERDGSHSPESGWVFVNLAQGFHRLTLRYFEDCEGQVLRIGIRTPDGYDGSLPEDRLFLTATDN